MSRDLLQSAQAVVAAALIGEGVAVVFDASIPHADLKGRVMHLPPLPLEVSPTALLHLRANCDHEMGHFAVTDPDAFSGAPGLLKTVLNSIEDGFIERWVSARWLGCAENLALSNALLIAQMKTEHRATPAHHTVVVESARKARAISALQTLAFGGSTADALATFGKEIEPELRLIEDLVPRFNAISKTAESLQLAEEVLERWGWRDPKEDRDKEPTKPAKAQGKKGGAAPNPSPTESEPAVAPSGLGDGEVSLAALRPFLFADRRAKAAARAIKAGFTGAPNYTPYTLSDIEETLAPEAPEGTTADFLEGVVATVPVLRRKLLIEFRGVKPRTLRGRRSGELDLRALHKVAMRHPGVFTQESASDVVDADVTLLVDRSGSMKGDSIQIAARAACAMSGALDQLRVQHEVLAFTTVGVPHEAARRNHRGPGYDRTAPLRHTIVKAVGHTWRQRRGAFATLGQGHDCHTNVDGESVLWAAHRLIARARPGMRQALIVFSDGEPSGMTESVPVMRWHLKHIIERVTAAGVACVGIGINTDAVKLFYPRYAVIDDVSQLAESSYLVIRDALQQSRRRVS